MPSRAAHQAFHEFLRLQRNGGGVSLDAFCSRHPELALGIRLLHSLHSSKGPSEAPSTTGHLVGLSVPAESATLSVQPGDDVGPYRIRRFLGSGGMGEVFLAEQVDPMRRLVALKVIKLGMDSSQVLARFEAERQALALMEHPSIARAYDAGTLANGRPYFVMEYVGGRPVTEHCDREKASVRDRLELFAAVCDGVQHAHEKGVIHRDLKPSNILVSARNDGHAVPKIIDFGVVKAMNQRLTDRTLLTELGGAVGTPPYMSPEQTERTSAGLDHRTDIYSLGVLLYELLAGVLPLDWQALHEASIDAVLRRIREEDALPPSVRLRRMPADEAAMIARSRSLERRGALSRALRGELDWITARAIEKDRRRRYATAADLAQDIRNHLASQPVIAGPPSSLYRLKKFGRRHRLAVLVSATAAAAFAGILTATVLLYVRATGRANELASRLARQEALLLDLGRGAPPDGSHDARAPSRPLPSPGGPQLAEAEQAVLLFEAQQPRLFAPEVHEWALENGYRASIPVFHSNRGVRSHRGGAVLGALLFREPYGRWAEVAGVDISNAAPGDLNLPVHLIRRVHNWAVAHRFAGAFPSMYCRTENNETYFSVALIPHPYATLRTVPAKELGGLEPTVVRTPALLMLRVQDWAMDAGYAGGYPTMDYVMEADGPEFQVLLIDKRYAEYRRFGTIDPSGAVHVNEPDLARTDG